MKRLWYAVWPVLAAVVGLGMWTLSAWRFHMVGFLIPPGLLVFYLLITELLWPCLHERWDAYPERKK